MKILIVILIMLGICFAFSRANSATLIAKCRLETPFGTYIPNKVLVEVYDETKLPLFNRIYSDESGTAVFKNLPKGHYKVRSIWIDASKNLNEYTQTISIEQRNTIEMDVLNNECFHL